MNWKTSFDIYLVFLAGHQSCLDVSIPWWHCRSRTPVRCRRSFSRSCWSPTTQVDLVTYYPSFDFPASLWIPYLPSELGHRLSCRRRRGRSCRHSCPVWTMMPMICGWRPRHRDQAPWLELTLNCCSPSWIRDVSKRVEDNISNYKLLCIRTLRRSVIQIPRSIMYITRLLSMFSGSNGCEILS